ncbi:MAG: ABC transporter permease [Marinoscillum sp.]|uniref:ABC transporter permease n=1 Tax=Marinoscillum sp. TaxID=2024838 RepID=UPI0032F1C790
MKRPGTPPKWLDRLLSWYCRPELLEDLQGDLHEYYHRNLHRGRFRANIIYLLDVIKFFRPYTIRKHKALQNLNPFFMLGSYFKTSVRSLARNKVFSAINIVGLAISMSVGILMITYLSELFSFDRFHQNGNRIYRVLTTYKGITNDEPIDLASTSIFIGKRLQQDYTGIERLTILRRNFTADLKEGERIISGEGLWASENFFDVFDFELVSGNPATVLRDPKSIVITESLAKKLFKDEQPVGRTIALMGQERYGFQSGMITGVVKDPPANSHMEFDMLGSLSTLDHYAAGQEEETFMTQYSSVWMNYVYLLLPENQRVDVVQKHLDQIAAEEGEKYDRFFITYALQNLQEIVPGRDLSNQIGPTVQWKMIYLLVGLTLIVILSACFNYTNLSIARSLRRAKEVGIRKVIGAGRGHIFTQFVFEAVMVAMIALSLAYGLFLLLKPEFIHLFFQNQVVTLDFQWIYLLYFVIFAFIIGLAAGILPSIFLSGLRALRVLKDPSGMKLFGGMSLRRMLIVFQFTLSIGFIIAATISYQQYQFAVNFDLGFETENILNVRLQGNDAEVLRSEFLKIPEVEGISMSGMLPATGEVWGDDAKYNDPLDSVSIHVNYVNKDYLELHQFEFLAGGTFPYDLKKDEDPRFTIINERLMRRFGMEDPHKALGEVLTVDRSKNVQIVGVVKDFQHQRISEGHEPFAFLQGYEDYHLLNLKVASDDMVELMSKLEAVWKEVDRVHPFQAEFYEDKIQKAYTQFQTYFKVIGFLAFLAISIAALGLLGMAIFTTETRMKEISIRKVLGATEQHLIYILSRGFVMMLLAASLIAVPVTYLLFEHLVLNDLANRVVIGPVELLSGVVVIFSVSMLTIGWQTTRAARTNPADMLRDE